MSDCKSCLEPSKDLRECADCGELTCEFCIVGELCENCVEEQVDICCVCEREAIDGYLTCWRCGQEVCHACLVEHEVYGGVEKLIVCEDCQKAHRDDVKTELIKRERKHEDAQLQRWKEATNP